MQTRKALIYSKLMLKSLKENEVLRRLLDIIIIIIIITTTTTT